MVNMTTNQSNVSMYSSFSFGTEPYFMYPITVFYVLIIVIATIGNTFVVLTICRWPSLRKSTTNFFILSLAVSDILTASIAMTLDLDLLLHDNKWQYSTLLCEIWATIYLSTVPISILTLMAVGLDRYKSLSDPLSRFREYQFMTRKRAAVVVLVIWVYSVTFAVIPFMGWNHYSVNVIAGECLFNITYIYSATSSLINFILPLMVTTLLYGKIYLIARRHSKDHNFPCAQPNDYKVHKTTRTTADQKNFLTNLKAARTVSLIVGGFLVCWLPFTTLSVVMCFCRECSYNVPEKLYAGLLVLGYSNCALNPFLYSFRNPKFRKCCKAMVWSLWEKNRQGSADRRPSNVELTSVFLKKQRLSDALYDRKDSGRLTSFYRLHSMPNGVLL